MKVPDNWEIIKVTETKTGTVIYKVMARWVGGYLSGERWQINSGIVSWTDAGDFYEFLGYSGSIYRCDKTRESMTNYMTSILENLKEKLLESGLGTVEVINMETLKREFSSAA